LSNGLAWSADGHTMFTVDSFQRGVFRRAWDASAGTWGPRTTHLEFDVGLPDGICLDEQDHLWVAMWGLGEVRRYAPNEVMVDSVQLPAPHVSSVAFAGPELDVLVITTATHELTPDQVERFPASGALFTWKPRVRGLQQAYWAGPS